MAQRLLLSNIRIIRVRPIGIVVHITMSILQAVHRIRGCCQAIQFLVVEVYHERVDYFHIR